MPIRTATLDDIEVIAQMGERFIAETPYAGIIAINPEQIRAFVFHLITDDNGVVFLAEDEDQAPIGMLGIFCFPHPMSRELIASEMFWWVNPESRGTAGIRLLHVGEEWAVAQGAFRMQMIAPNAHVEHVYEKLGYQPIERTYQKVLATV